MHSDGVRSGCKPYQTQLPQGLLPSNQSTSRCHARSFRIAHKLARSVFYVLTKRTLYRDLGINHTVPGKQRQLVHRLVARLVAIDCKAEQILEAFDKQRRRTDTAITPNQLTE